MLGYRQNLLKGCDSVARVSLHKVGKRYAKQFVIRDLHLDIPDGSFTVFVGPSGCGKTTTLRMIAGLEEITEGEIWIGDQVVNEIPPGKRDVAMVFQNYALYPTMNVYDNIAFGLRNRGVPKDECKRLVTEVAELVGLGSYLQRHPSQLSGGQRQRVALARAMVKKPQVFLMDEPLSNLDAKLRSQMRVELTSLHRQLGSTFLYVTHDQVEAMTMGDTIVVMHEGQVQQMGSPLTLYREPANLFVAQFIGSPPMNILEAEKGEGHLIGFRPEKAEMRPPSSAAHVSEGALTLTGRIWSREILGADVLCNIVTARGRVIVKTNTDLQREEGEEVQVSVAQTDLYFFDQQTGKRLPARPVQPPISLVAGVVSG